MNPKEDPYKKIAVLIPCFNEEKTVAGVVNDFRTELPDAEIYVFDNNSSDNTVKEAIKAGAIVGYEKRQGKGNVIRTMFRQVDADVYVIVDGDGTYPANRVNDLIQPVLSGEADMVIGSRLHPLSESNFKTVNFFGNKLFLLLLNTIFRVKLTDLLSGYRALGRQVVKNIPILSRGFEVETELTVKSLERGYIVKEIPINLSQRPEGSRSKINVVRDGLLIFNTIFSLFRDYKPLTAFGLFGIFLIICGLVPGIIVIREFFLTGYILSIPSVILSVGFVLSGILVLFIGLVIHTILRRFQELDYQIQNLNETVFKKKNKTDSIFP
jgi:glycosyltransferase involved in cell wall biosynthesis